MAMNIILVTGTREKLQMAAMIAAVSAVSEEEVNVFVSMNAIEYFLVDGAAKCAPSEGKLGELLESKNAPPFMQIVDQAVELGGAKFHPCSMAMDLLGVGQSELLPFMEKPLGLTKFLADTKGQQVLVF
jgi:peroxiredoxin family protein